MQMYMHALTTHLETLYSMLYNDTKHLVPVQCETYSTK